MNLVNGAIAGVVGGLVGAAIWAGISYGTGYEVGYVAWGIGGLVGFCVAAAGKGKGGEAAFMAVVITALSIVGGKYAAVELLIWKEVGSQQQVTQNAIQQLDSKEAVISYVADEVISDREDRGEPIVWPAGVDPSYAYAAEDYPKEIWAEATARWEGKSDDERAAFKNEIAENIRQNMGAYFDEAARGAFLASFGGMDLLFFGLAIVTAYSVAKNGVTDDSEGEEAEQADEEPTFGPPDA